MKKSLRTNCMLVHTAFILMRIYFWRRQKLPNRKSDKGFILSLSPTVKGESLHFTKSFSPVAVALKRQCKSSIHQARRQLLTGDELSTCCGRCSRAHWVQGSAPENASCHTNTLTWCECPSSDRTSHGVVALVWHWTATGQSVDRHVCFQTWRTPLADWKVNKWISWLVTYCRPVREAGTQPPHHHLPTDKPIIRASTARRAMDTAAIIHFFCQGKQADYTMPTHTASSFLGNCTAHQS
jgi:hypothetical protein